MTKKIVNYLKEIAYEYKLIDLLRKFYWMVKSSIRVGEKVSITVDSVESVFYVNSSAEYSVINAIYDESAVIKKNNGGVSRWRCILGYRSKHRYFFMHVEAQKYTYCLF
jgi:hypothetical protein